jgi:hypothetical protein
MVALVSLVSFAAAPAAAQVCTPTIVEAKVTQIEHELDSKSGSVRLHRVEDLEDEVFVPRAGSTDVNSRIRFYQVQEREFIARDGVVQQGLPPGSALRFVAVSCDGEHVYRLGGFDSAEEEFARLVKDTPLPTTSDSSGAEARALFCAKVLYGAPPSLWILGENAARLKASEHFFGEGKNDGFRRADEWWKSVSTSDPSVKVGIATSELTQKTFRTRIPLFWAPVETHVTPRVRWLEINVAGSGACRRQDIGNRDK